MTPIRIGLAGCGAISETYYAPALRELERTGEVQVVALMDPSPERTALFKDGFPGASFLGGLAGMSKARPDLVIVASPPRFHAEQTVALLKAGIPVLCEKPMANTVAEAEEMAAAARDSGKALAIGLFRRFFPALRAMREIIARGSLGPVRSFSIAEGGVFGWPAQSASFFQKASSKGGVLLDAGVHALDIVQWWFGEPSELAYADDAMGGLEANCRVEMGYGAFSGQVQLSRDTQLANRYVVQCEKAWMAWNPLETNRFELQFEGTGQALAVMTHPSPPDKYRTRLKTPDADFYGCFINQLRNARAAVLGEEEVFIPAEEGIKSLRLIERCYGERKFLEMPWLSERENRQAAALAGGDL